MATKTSSSVQALSKGLEIISLFQAQRTLSLTEISKQIGLPLSTAHRILRTLEEHQFVQRDAASKRYRPGLGVLRPVPALLSSLDIPSAVRPVVRELSAETGETANLAVLDGIETVYLVGEIGRYLLSGAASPGLRLPAHCTALGLCMLAQLSDTEARLRLGPEPYPRRTALTPVTWSDVSAQLTVIRQRGYALSVEQYEIGLCACALPIIVTNAADVYAVNVSAPLTRWSAEYVDEQLLPALRRAAAGMYQLLRSIDALRGGSVRETGGIQRE